MVIWLVGMSGAGKTTIGKQLYAQIKDRHTNTVFVDGDTIRKFFRHDQKTSDYSIEGRRHNAERIRDLCLWLDNQNINVVCCILCIFPDILKENRTLFEKYYEVYVHAPFEVLEERDTKGLYAAARDGSIDNLVGVQIPFPEPTASNIKINTSDDESVESIKNRIVKELEGKFI